MAPRNEYDGSAIRDEREEDLFTTIGRRVERLEIDETINVKRGSNEAGADGDERAEAKVVDKIESLCMNCEENVSRPITFNCNRIACWLTSCYQSKIIYIYISHVG